MKPGYKTSELYVVLAALGVNVANVPHGAAQWATALSAGLYAVARALTKFAQGQPLNVNATDLLDRLFGQTPPSSASTPMGTAGRSAIEQPPPASTTEKPPGT